MKKLWIVGLIILVLGCWVFSSLATAAEKAYTVGVVIPYEIG
ncbi:MAG: hypothetical protein ACUVQZ_03040 [Candidatus Caldatribacteriaceae bacterium]